MYIANISISYKNPPLGFPDRFALVESAKRELYEDLVAHENIEGALILQTCNRFEVYFTDNLDADGIKQAKEVLINRFGEDIKNHMDVKSYLKTVKHLFRVVSSLESMVIGEDQILSQFREAFKYASNLGYTNRVLNLVFDKALKLGKQVRTETQISKGKVSISSVAVDMAENISSLKNKRVLLIGNGRMASLVAEYLKNFDISEIFVVGRTSEKVIKFCEIYGAQGANFRELPEILSSVDIVFSATKAPHTLIKKDIIKRAMTNRILPLIIVDIAVPSDVDPSASEIPNVRLYSIKDLKNISNQNLKNRMEEVCKVEKIIEEEHLKFANKIQNLHIERYFASLIKYTESIRCKELEKAVQILGNVCEPKVKKVLEGFSKSLMKKLMHNFLSEIRTNPLNEKELKKFAEIFIGYSS